jgi:Bacteriophage HK97-gp10, putative tail-component
MKTKLTWFGDQVQAKLTDNMTKRVGKVAKKLANAIKANISVDGPEPSSPGEYPHRQTGELYEGIKVVQRNQYRFDVVSTAEHAGIVEETRPYFERTLQEEFGMLRRTAEGAS